MTGLLDLICERLVGRPLADCSWQELARIRDDLDRALNAQVNRKQTADLPAGGAA